MGKIIKYVNLDAITPEHMLGKWEVIDRVVNEASRENIFSDIKIMEIHEGSYTSVNGKQRTGEWQVKRNTSIIYNPQLQFFINEAEVGKAIITRLRNEIEAESNIVKLTLYFNTGLELIMCKKVCS